MKPSPQLLGAEFEDEVAKIYEALGYQVDKDVEIDGQQIDLVVSLDRPGVGKATYMVECKYKSTGKVTNQDVFDSLHVYAAIRRASPITGAVLVTNNGFTRSAKRAAIPHPDVVLMPSSRLKAETKILSRPTHLLKQYEGSLIFSTYVPQQGYGRLPNISKDGPLRDLGTTLSSWTLPAKQGVCFILGDYGTGKTTLLRRVRYLHLKRRAAGDNAPLPVFFLLRNFYKFDKLDDFVVHSFHENYHSIIEPDWFWQEAESRSLLLLLDGFDEISIESNTHVRQMLLARIAPLLDTKSPTLISCRPSYFIDTAEFDRLVLRHNLALAGPREGITRSSRNVAWSAQEKARDLRARIVHRYSESPSSLQRSAYPRSRIELLATPDEIHHFVRRIYDLTDFMKRPILL
jgi:hypothetical protein